MFKTPAGIPVYDESPSFLLALMKRGDLSFSREVRVHPIGFSVSLDAAKRGQREKRMETARGEIVF